MRIDTNNTKYILGIMKTTTSVKIDKNIKDEATALANELGLSLSSVINATLKKFVIERRVVLSVAPEFNQKTRKRFLKMREDVRNGKNLSRAFDNTEDLFKALKI
jgi:addiction module RelB/DinJ family antitoxin